MLKAKVGYSTNSEDFKSGKETVEKVVKGLNNKNIGILYTSSLSNIKEVIKGIRSVSNMPIIGSTSEGIMTSDGYIESNNKYSSMMVLDDKDMIVSISSHEKGKDARAIGRKVAIEAVEKSKTERAPAYFYMIASSNEEEYLQGIEDVIGRVPMFGGTTSNKIICNDKVLADGVAVAFFYTDNEIETSFTSGYKETNNVGIITKTRGNNDLVEINNNKAIDEYAKWINKDSNDIEVIEKEYINKPLGIKDSINNLLVVRNIDRIKTNMTLSNSILENTSIINLKATKEDFINAPVDTIKELNKKLYTRPALYILMHNELTKNKITKIDEVYEKVKKETKNTPFIMPFTNGEYGYNEHSSNTCGSLMLSFTVFGKN
ncbi:MAG: hypothetical protein IJF92_02245 [Bacilli bacterium]|nr:hypothetical protein [Bacilli bacterium]